MTDLIIRQEQPVDHPVMENLVRDAFWDVYRPGASEHLLIHKLRSHPSYLPEFSFVAELGDRLAGGIWYAMCAIEKPDGSRIPIPTLGPVGVAPAFQKRGVGSALIRHSLPLVKAAGHPGVVLFGDPAYYGRFGFTPGRDAGIRGMRRQFLRRASAGTVRRFRGPCRVFSGKRTVSDRPGRSRCVRDMVPAAGKTRPADTAALSTSPSPDTKKPLRIGTASFFVVYLIHRKRRGLHCGSARLREVR